MDNLNLEIHYYQQDEGYVFIENNLVDKEEIFGEILLFCCYTLRILINLGNADGTGLSLAYLFNKIDHNNILEFVEYQRPNHPKLVEYQGQGRKQFNAKLSFLKNYRFCLNTKGFGLFGKGIGYYAPTSVIILLKYLALRRKTNTEYLDKLSKAAAYCGSLYLDGQINIKNQGQVAFLIASEIFQVKDGIVNG